MTDVPCFNLFLDLVLVGYVLFSTKKISKRAFVKKSVRDSRESIREVWFLSCWLCFNIVLHIIHPEGPRILDKKNAKLCIVKNSVRESPGTFQADLLPTTPESHRGVGMIWADVPIVRLCVRRFLCLWTASRLPRNVCC